MKISSKSITAIKMLIDLGEHYNDGYSTLSEIAKRKEISKKFLEQIIPLYRNSNLLTVTRGNQGGYRLAKPSNEITLKEIIYVTENDLNKSDTIDPTINYFMDEIDLLLDKYFSSITLDKLIEKEIESYSINYCI